MIVFLFKLAVSVALLAVLFAQTDLARIADAARQAHVPWLVAALGLYLVMILASAWRWNLLLAAQDVSVRRRTLVQSFLVATFFNSFLPSNIGGDVIRIRDTSQPAGSMGRATMIVGLDRVIGLLGLLFVAAVASSTSQYATPHDTPPLGSAVLWLLFVAMTTGLLVFIATPSLLEVVLKPFPLARRDSVARRVTVLVEMLRRFRSQPSALLACFVGALVAQGVLVAFYVAIARSLSIPISTLHLAVVVPVSFVLQLLPISVNGFGVREATFTYYFSALELPVESALVLSLLGAGLVLLVSLLGGVLYVARR
jgi:uncharacterized protein (TIRG00374 family)